MTKLFKAPKAPVYTPIADAQDVPASPKAPTPEEISAADIKTQKDAKRRYGTSGRAGTVISGGSGGGGLG